MVNGKQLTLEIPQRLIYARLNITPEDLACFCDRAGIVELGLFGSVLRDDFRVDSDIDVLVTFSSDVHLSLLEFVSLEQELEELFRREVDLVEKSVVEADENWIRREAILKESRVIYESRCSISSSL
jgi:hypothetical protein